jgi:iron complex outermembrane recepter protein
MKRGLLVGASATAVAIVAGLSGSQALAQPAAPATGTAGTTVDEVLVTAEKRSVSLEKVPVAVTAFPAHQRDLVGIKSIQDLSDYTPGLSYNVETNRPTIRGIGRNTDLLATESAVALYVDNVYQSPGIETLLQPDSLFTDRVEILRGPQGTLYGRNSDGGAINYISRMPSHTQEEEIRAGVDNYDKYYVEGRISGPINDHIRLSVSGNYTQQNGHYYNNLNGGGTGGSIAEGANGTSHYVEAQIAANYGNLDLWGKVSSGEFNIGVPFTASLGQVGDFEYQNTGLALAPNNNFGLCDPALAALNHGVGCGAGFGNVDSVVPGSTVTLAHAAFTNPSSTNIRNYITDFTGGDDLGDDLLFSGSATYHFPSADLKYIGGYRSFSATVLLPTSGSGVASYSLQGPTAPNPLCIAAFGFPPAAGCTGNLKIFGQGGRTSFGEDEEFFSHEVDLTSTWKGPFQYIGGLYWYHEHFTQPIYSGNPDQPQTLTPQFLTPTLGFVPAPANPTGALFNTNADMREDSYAAFGQVDWSITDTLKLTGGLRYTQDSKSGVQTERLIEFAGVVPPFFNGAQTYGALTPAIDLTPVLFGTPLPATKGAAASVYNAATGFETRSLSGSWNAVTGTAGLEWTPDSHNLVYVKYSRGYKTGGFNTGSISTTPETAAEYVDSYEGGWKLSHDTFQLNSAIFYYDYQNDQQPLSALDPISNQTISSIFNIPHVHTYGLELEGIWHPVAPLILSAQYTYLSAKIHSSTCAVDGADPLAIQPGANPAGCPVGLQQIRGQTLPNATPNKVSLNAIYTWDFDPGSLALSGSFIWKDQTYDSIFNRSYNLIPSYTQVNLHATWTDVKNRYTVSAFVDNVFDSVGYEAGSGASGGLGNISSTGDEFITHSFGLTAPRTFGVEVQYRWR